jgi:hypothetical protein
MKDDDFGFVLVLTIIASICIFTFILFVTNIIDYNVFKSCESINHYYINDKRSIKCEVIQK